MRVGTLSFFWHVFLATIVPMFVVLLVYLFSIRIGFFRFITLDGVMNQIIKNGFTVTFIVNCLAFSYYPIVVDKLAKGSLKRSLLFILLDTAAKLLLFIVIEFAVFALFAVSDQGFNSDSVAAVKAVPPTIAAAIRFENLTGVYLYSVAISSFRFTCFTQ